MCSLVQAELASCRVLNFSAYTFKSYHSPARKIIRKESQKLYGAKYDYTALLNYLEVQLTLTDNTPYQTITNPEDQVALAEKAAPNICAPTDVRGFCLRRNVQSGSGTHLPSNSMGTAFLSRL